MTAPVLTLPSADSSVPPLDDHRELRRRVQEAGLLVPQSRSFGISLLITGGLLVAGIAFLIAFHALWGVLIGALFLSVVSVQIAFLVHDAGHRQGFLRRWQNALVGVIGGDLLLGASYGWWIGKHNEHHAHPNHADMDPDIELPMIAFTAAQAMEKRGVQRLVVKHQVWCALPLLSLVTYGQRLSSARYVLREHSRYRRWEAAALILNAALYIGLPLYLLGPWSALLFITVHQACTGIYLGLVFAPNHKGMVMIDDETPLDPLRAQVLTARNVYGHPVTDWLYGGLNYQIEHHLFPSMSRSRLHRAQRIVAAFCRERDITYHETSVIHSYVEILASLRAAAAPLQSHHPHHDSAA
ncbi:MAG: acyl-CoA desaturase [Thermomicrobia bacterium]|nr:acyl-CoA desaturase [Thermomicrobia bacterium]MCA1725873.1 acyl-CoA desaturase [Thermomicrobia bacterium]